MSMKFIHIADVHLGATPDASMPWAKQRAHEIWDGFDALLEKVREEKADFLLIAGDLFHRQPLMRELKEVNYRFEKLKPTKVVLMAGNHDYLRQDSLYRKMQWAQNVYFFSNAKAECFYFEDVRTYIYGLSYMDYEVTDPMYDCLCPVKENGCHILLAHGGDAQHIPMKYEQIAKAGFDYVAMGHIHKPQMMYDGKMAYAGALSPIDKNDEGAHGYVLGQYEDGVLQTSFVKLPTRSYVSVSVCMDGTMPWSMALDLLRTEMELQGMQNIFKVTLTGFRNPDIEVSAEDVHKLGMVVDVTDDTRPDYDFDEIYMKNKDNIIGMFIERIQNLPAEEVSKEKALYYGLKALFQTMDRK